MTVLENRRRGSTIGERTFAVLLVTVMLAPLSMAKLPFLDQPLTLTAFAFPQTLVLILGVSLSLVLWAASLWTCRSEVWFSRWMAPFAALAIWAAISTLTGLEPLRSLFGKSTSALSLVGIVTYVALLFLSVQLIDSRKRLQWLTWGVVLSASAVAALALWQQIFNVELFGLPPSPEWFVGRGYSTIGNPDHLGTFLVLPALLAAMLAVFEQMPRRRVAALGCFAVLAAALAGTLTRGAWVAALAGLVLMGILVWRIRPSRELVTRTAVALGLLLAAVLLAVAASDSADLSSRFATGDPGMREALVARESLNQISSGRIDLWHASLLVAGDRPLTGTGPAAFELGWYPNAIRPSSGGGGWVFADDPHSVPLFALSTMGIPGLLFYLLATASVLWYGARTVWRITADPRLAGKGMYYASWLVAAAGLQVALLLAAVSSPIMMYLFLSCGVLLRPSASALRIGRSPGSRLVPVGTTALLALLLTAGIYPTAAAEISAARSLTERSIDGMHTVWTAVPWNMDVGIAYFSLRDARVRRGLDTGTQGVGDDVRAIARDLAVAADEQPHEFYYPALRAKILTRASEVVGDPSYAEAAIEAADEALAIMPANIGTRVDKALALGDLGRYDAMVDVLSDHWQAERDSAYPGVIYAQALALSGDHEEADRVFATLLTHFPEEASFIESARAQVDTQAR